MLSDREKRERARKHQTRCNDRAWLKRYLPTIDFSGIEIHHRWEQGGFQFLSIAEHRALHRREKEYEQKKKQKSMGLNQWGEISKRTSLSVAECEDSKKLGRGLLSENTVNSAEIPNTASCGYVAEVHQMRREIPKDHRGLYLSVPFTHGNQSHISEENGVSSNERKEPSVKEGNE